MTRRRLPPRRVVIVAALSTTFAVCSGGGIASRVASGSATATPGAPAAACATGPARAGADGIRRVALVVGVGRYASPNVPTLEGPPYDARRMAEMLTAPNGYGFPKENVCVLVDEQATTERFRRAFQEALVDRIQRKEDVAVLFFAGHGSQVSDQNGDEPDQMDETLALHDARFQGVTDLRDDELNGMLATLAARTQHVTALFDSCNSGTAARDLSALKARRLAPVVTPRLVAAPMAGSSSDGDGAAGVAPRDIPGLVVLSAAADGSVALESAGSGIFTDALIQVLSDVGPSPLLYSQVARQVPPLVRSRGGAQVPFFHGDLRHVVFGNETRTRPFALEVRAVGSPLELAGPPVPGLGVGAELRVYAGNATAAELRDPAHAKATVVVESAAPGLNPRARLDTPVKGTIARGDIAVLVRPATSFTKVNVRLRPPAEPGGLSPAREATLRAAWEQDAYGKLLVTFVAEHDELEVGVTPAGHYGIWGPENRLRNEFRPNANLRAEDIPKEVVRHLWMHARQKAFQQLRGEGGADFVDDQTLEVRAVPQPPRGACARGAWIAADANKEQVMPPCRDWQIQVTNRGRKPLLVGGLVLSSDGGILGFPFPDEQETPLPPGATRTIARPVFESAPPLDINDHVLVFGTQPTNPVDWYMLTLEARTRGDAQPRGTLGRAIDGYLNQTRGQKLKSASEDTTWTRSTLPVRVLAHAEFAEPEPTQPLGTREYTLSGFDVSPYLPKDPSSALRQVLEQAHALATRSAADGVSYKQHEWKEPNDDANLRKGIDCSRAIWYAFTRAKLPYNDATDAYLATAQMVGARTHMADRFETCSDAPRLGDVLVYRDDVRGDGHVVLVIDYAKRIAWGSHGWDGNVSASQPAGDSGVEYQLIKVKKDWERWDRKTMQLKACWRYRTFAEEERAGKHVARALEEDPCVACGAP